MKYIETYAGRGTDIDYYADPPAQIFAHRGWRGSLSNNFMISFPATGLQTTAQTSRHCRLPSEKIIPSSGAENLQSAVQILQTLHSFHTVADPYLEIAKQFGFPIIAKLSDQLEFHRKEVVELYDPLCKPTTKTTLDGFLQPVLQLEKGGHIDAALDILYDRMDDLLKRKQFATMDSLLRQANVDSLSVDILLGLLTSSLPARSKLPSRSRLFDEAKTSIERRGEWEDGLFSGLES